MKRTRILFLSLSCILISSLLTSFISANRVETISIYEMYVNDEGVGTIKFAAKGLNIYDSTIAELTEQYPEDAAIEAEVYFKEVDAGNKALSDESTIQAAIIEAARVTVDAYAVNIDGETLCYVRTPDEAAGLIEDFKTPYIEAIISTNTSQLEETIIKEDIQIVKENIPYELLTSESQAMDMLKQDGLLSVVTSERINSFEELPYKTEVKEDKDLEKGKTKVIQQGKKGKKEIITRIVKENGTEIERTIVEEIIIDEPINHIEAKGTKVKATVVQPKPVVPAPPSESGTQPAPTNPVPMDRGSARGSDIVDFAKQYLGKPYKYATAGPNSFDCSGFTWFVYKHFGISVPRDSSSQGYTGKSVSRADLMPGDLVVFTSPNSGGAVGHAGIYIGGGNFIHASSGKEMSVIISTLDSGNYAARYKGGRRVIN